MEIENCDMAEKIEKLDIHHLALTILELITSILLLVLFLIINLYLRKILFKANKLARKKTNKSI